MYKISDKEKDPFKDHVRKHSKNTAKHCVICNERGSDDFDLKHHVQSQVNILSHKYFIDDQKII